MAGPGRSRAGLRSGGQHFSGYTPPISSAGRRNSHMFGNSHRTHDSHMPLPDQHGGGLGGGGGGRRGVGYDFGDAMGGGRFGGRGGGGFGNGFWLSGEPPGFHDPRDRHSYSDSRDYGHHFSNYWPRMPPWYPGAPHQWQFSGPQAEAIPPMDEISFADAFKPTPPDRALSLQGVRDFHERLGKLIGTLEDLKLRFETKAGDITIFSSQETLSKVWHDFIGTRGALNFQTGGALDDKRDQRGVHILQTECEDLRHRLNEISLESSRGSTFREYGSQEVSSVLARVKRQGAEIVSAIYLMPKHLRYMDQAIADTIGLRTYLEKTEHEWIGEEELRQIVHDRERAVKRAASAMNDGKNVGTGTGDGAQNDEEWQQNNVVNGE